jgi:predicted dehydrogenase
MLKAAKESGKVVQVGLHRRIGPHHVSALKFLKDGGAGQVGMVRLFAHYGGGRRSRTPTPRCPKG